ncbi:MAG: hypothetical protein WCK84_07885 [Bacteroidota bacterium]
MDKKTKSITITQFDYVIRNVNDEELDIQGHPYHYNEFDMDGRPLTEIKYSRYGDFEEKVEYGYDSTGNLIRESYYPEENVLAEEKTFNRNEAGQVICVLKHYQDGSVDTIDYQYNESDQLVKKTITTDEGEVEQVETFEWENDTLSNHNIFDGMGEPVAAPDEITVKPNQTRITYNDKEQIVTEEELDENGEIITTINRIYNENGLADEVEVFIDGRGKTISRHYYLKYEYAYFD